MLPKLSFRLVEPAPRIPEEVVVLVWDHQV